MSWSRLEDQFYDHPKVRRVWAEAPEAVGLWVLALTYASRHMTDGYIDALWLLERCRTDERYDRCVTALLRHGLLEQVEGDPEHLLIHDYLEFHDSRAEITAKREADTARKRKAGAAGGAASGRSRARASAVRTDSARNPIGRPTESATPPPGVPSESEAPDPTRPDPTPSSTTTTTAGERPPGGEGRSSSSYPDDLVEQIGGLLRQHTGWANPPVRDDVVAELEAAGLSPGACRNAAREAAQMAALPDGAPRRIRTRNAAQALAMRLADQPRPGASRQRSAPPKIEIPSSEEGLDLQRVWTTVLDDPPPRHGGILGAMDLVAVAGDAAWVRIWRGEADRAEALRHWVRGAISDAAGRRVDHLHIVPTDR